MRNRLGVRGHLLMAFFGISAFAVLAAAAAMYAFLEVDKALDRITQQRVPSVLSSLEISRQAERIVAVAPTLLTVATPAQRETLSGRIAAEIEKLDALLLDLRGSGSDAAVLELIERDVAQLKTNFDALDLLVAKRLEAAERKSALLRRLSSTHNAGQRLIAPGLMVVEGDLSQLQRVLDDRDLSSEARIASASGLMSSIAASPPLQRIQIEALNINNVLRRVASAPRPTEVAILAFPLGRSLDSMESLADKIGPVVRRRLLARIGELRSFVGGPNSILDARRNELAILADSERLLGENVALSAGLTKAVDLLVAGANRDIGQANLEAQSVQRVGTGVLIAVVALSLISSTLIVWLYVGRNLIARLTALSGSMLAIAGGQLDTPVPAAGGDEIGDMAKALAVFRETAIEVKETNLREIREARLRLVDAIESISEGFSLFDSEDRLVVSNTRYRELFNPGAEDADEQGVSFETIIRKAAEKGYIEDAEGRIDEWLSERLARHRDPGGPQLERGADGRWIQISERRTEDGGTVAVYTDVTELRRAEEALRESEERYALAIQGSNEGLADWDVESDVIHLSPRFKAISGLPADSLETTPAQWLARMHPDDRTRYQDDLRAHLRGGTDFFSCEFRLLSEQGDYRWVQGSARGLRNEAGRVYRMVFSIADITERRQAEEEVRKVWDAIEGLSEGFALYDADDRLVKCNQRYREIFSSIAHRMVPGTSFEEVLDAAGAENVFETEEGFEAWKRERIEEHHQPSEEGLLQRAQDGSWILVKEHRIQDGGYLSIRTDVTELKRAEEALSDQLKFTEALFDTIPNPISVKDPERRYLNFNRAYEETFGIRREDYIGKTVMDRENIPLERRERAHREDDELLRTGGTEYAETVRELADDELHDMLSWRTAFELSSGVVGGIVTVQVDISERKRAEEALSDQLKFTEALIDTLPNPIVVKGFPERRYLNFNRAYEKAFGVQREDYIGKTAMEMEHIPLEMRQRVDREDDELIRTGGTLQSEVRRKLADGEEHDMLSLRTAFELSSGVGGFVGVLVDISEQKSMARDLAGAKDALEEAYDIIKIRSDRMEDELNIGREIQMSMVPLIFPPFPVHDEFSIFAALEPAREVGGDFYDFYFIDEDRLCVCIGDVSGKGVPSALFMAVAKTLIKSRAGDDRSTASILTHVNDELAHDNKTHMFVTIFVAILDIGSGELVYTNAGHNPPYFKRADGTLERLDRRHGPVVGAVEGMVYKEDRDRMAPGDLLLLYTDGVTEARGPDDAMFSEERLRDLLASRKATGVEHVVADTVAAVRDFEQETEQADDITLLALAFHGSPRDAPSAERRIVINNRLPDIADVNAAFDEFAAEFEIPMPIATKFNLVFDELLNNVITFAYRDGAEHEIEINIERARNRLTATIVDDGVPFNPLGAEIPDITLSLADRETGGLGIHLARNLVDELSYQRRIGRNVVTMTSRLDADNRMIEPRGIEC